MSIQLVIAEKPSVARSIAGVIGADQKRDGYMEGNGYLVSWCIGHLVSLADAGAYYYVAYTITDYDNATSGSGVTTTALSNRTGHAWNFNFSDSVSGKSLPMPPANYAKGATTTRPSNLADTYYNTYTANTGVTLNRSLYDVHHIRPLAYGGSNAYSNLIHLPKATHTQVTSWWAGY